MSRDQHNWACQVLEEVWKEGWNCPLIFITNQNSTQSLSLPFMYGTSTTSSYTTVIHYLHNGVDVEDLPLAAGDLCHASNYSVKIAHRSWAVQREWELSPLCEWGSMPQWLSVSCLCDVDRSGKIRSKHIKWMRSPLLTLALRKWSLRIMKS